MSGEPHTHMELNWATRNDGGMHSSVHNFPVQRRWRACRAAHDLYSNGGQPEHADTRGAEMQAKQRDTNQYTSTPECGRKNMNVVSC